MTTDQLQQALAHDGYVISNATCVRIASAFATPPAGQVPDLGFLPPALEVAVLAALYRDLIAQARQAAPQPAQ